MEKLYVRDLEIGKRYTLVDLSERQFSSFVTDNGLSYGEEVELVDLSRYYTGVVNFDEPVRYRICVKSVVTGKETWCVRGLHEEVTFLH